ncbi:unnamed protein product [Coffea canephora]|uniref:Extensin domain-containing protein n=1 Tax=Coffea canephora TaxID=49390 RepID=A0A068V2D4_COFCA|nr:unnamed protein product [Coffea canephora]
MLVKVVGKVYCYRCYDWDYPKKSHDKKHLKGAVVEVTCKVGDKKIVAYGKTKINGKYSITLEGFDYGKYGAKACMAKLHMAPKDSKCNIPTNLHWGKTGAELRVKSKTDYEVVLYAKPFAYAPKTPYEECEKPKPTPAPYHYISPPPPTYVYKSPPPPPPTYLYKSPPPPVKPPPKPYYYVSPPPPTYVYKSPPPPPPTYLYKSPPPPVKPPPKPYHYVSPPPPTVSPPHYYYTSPPPPVKPPPKPNLHHHPILTSPHHRRRNLHHHLILTSPHLRRRNLHHLHTTTPHLPHPKNHLLHQSTLMLLPHPQLTTELQQLRHFPPSRKFPFQPKNKGRLLEKKIQTSNILEGHYIPQ